MFYAQSYNRIVRSPAIDDLASFDPTNYISMMEQDIAIRHQICSDTALCTRLRVFGYEVYNHLNEDPAAFSLGIYTALMAINKKMHICLRDEIIDNMRNVQWINDFVRKATTEARVSSVCVAILS
jgi:hypothetical protein